MSQNVSISVVCPFYRRHKENGICCEGIDSTNSVNLVFGDSKKLKEYTKCFCADIKCHKGCMIFQMLNSKYKGES